METKNTHIQYDKHKKMWILKIENDNNFVEYYSTQKLAIENARKITYGEMNIHRKDNNQIRQKDTIGKKDPRNIKG